MLVLILEDDLQVGGHLMQEPTSFLLIDVLLPRLVLCQLVLDRNILFALEEALQQFKEADAFLGGRVFVILFETGLYVLHVIDAIVLEGLAPPAVIAFPALKEAPDVLVVGCLPDVLQLTVGLMEGDLLE